MLSITPCRNSISDRFPVASFVVHVPSDRVFEIACATDPSLFRSDQRNRRAPGNFFTSRGGGLLRAPAGQATYLLPPQQLRRFAGSRRLYFTLGAYDGRGQQAAFTTPPERCADSPFVTLSPEFTGRALDRSRLARGAEGQDRYGGGAALLAWGGDHVASAPGEAPPAAAAPPPYDDGYPSDLWTRAPRVGGAAPRAAGEAMDPSDPSDPADPEAAFAAGTEEPPGYEDGVALQAGRAAPVAPAPRARATYGRRDEPEAQGVEHVAALSRAAYGRRGDPEVPGSEHAAPPPRARRAVLGGGASAAEPQGIEHPAELRRGARYGDVEDLKARLSAAPATAGGAFAPPGVDDEYEEQLGPDAEGELAGPGTGAAPLEAGAAEPLTIEQKFRLILPVAAFESGAERYGAVNPDSEYNDPRHPAYQRYHIGLSWGLVQFTQRGGALGRALRAFERRSGTAFRRVFGPASDALLATTNAPTEEERVQPVDGAFLWEEPWLGRFRAAGDVPEACAAQNEVAIEDYLDANLSFAACLGFDTDRALAMLYDRCVNMGNAGGRRWVLAAVSPIRSDADRAAALDAIGAASVEALQRRTAGLHADGVFGSKTHAALLAELRRLGPRSPVAVPELDAMLDAMVEAARGRRFADRVARLRTTPDLADVHRQVA